jgi:hypothetical protein
MGADAKKVLGTLGAPGQNLAPLGLFRT